MLKAYANGDQCLGGKAKDSGRDGVGRSPSQLPVDFRRLCSVHMPVN